MTAARFREVQTVARPRAQAMATQSATAVGGARADARIVDTSLDASVTLRPQGDEHVREASYDELLALKEQLRARGGPVSASSAQMQESHLAAKAIYDVHAVAEVTGQAVGAVVERPATAKAPPAPPAKKKEAPAPRRSVATLVRALVHALHRFLKLVVDGDPGPRAPRRAGN